MSSVYVWSFKGRNETPKMVFSIILTELDSDVSTQTNTIYTPVLWPPNAKSQLTGKDPDAGKDWRQEEEGWQDEMVGWHHWLNRHEFKQVPGDGEGQGSLACCSPRGDKESDVPEQLKRNTSVSFVTVQVLRHVWLFETPWTDCSPPGSSVCGIFPARILEWGVSSFSKAS